MNFSELRSLNLTFVKGNKSALFKMSEDQRKKKIEVSQNKDIDRAVRRSKFYKLQLERSEVNLASKKIKKNHQVQNRLGDQIFMEDNGQNDENRSESMH